MGRKRAKEDVAAGSVPGRDIAMIADPDRPGSYVLRVAGTDQSYIDLTDPLHLEFDYVEKIAEVLHAWRQPPQRIRILHIGGGGLTLPRYVAATRPTSAQIVLEPDEELTTLVRQIAPLPVRSGIKIRPQDGLSGLAQTQAASQDVIMLDAFAAGVVPGELATKDFFALAAATLAVDGIFVANIADQAPFYWSRRFVAGMYEVFGEVTLGALTSTWRGRRYGNMVAVGGVGVDIRYLQRRAAGAAFPYRWVAGDDIAKWILGYAPWKSCDPVSSMPPMGLITNWLDI
ncbi:MAG: spermidine synthase [Propionibacteriaceae bacterium]